MLATAGGIVALIALPVIVAASVLPYAQYDPSAGGPSSSPSIVNGGYANSWSNVAEPAVVFLFTMVAAALLIVSTHRILGTLAAGALLAMGAQTVALFFGYGVTAIAFGQIGPGSVAGLVGGVLLFAAGALSAAGVLSSGAPTRS